MRAIIYYNKLRYADDVVILASTEDNILALVNIIWHSSIIIIIIYTPRKHFCQLFRMFCGCLTSDTNGQLTDALIEATLAPVCVPRGTRTRKPRLETQGPSPTKAKYYAHVRFLVPVSDSLLIIMLYYRLAKHIRYTTYKQVPVPRYMTVVQYYTSLEFLV